MYRPRDRIDLLPAGDPGGQLGDRVAAAGRCDRSADQPAAGVGDELCETVCLARGDCPVKLRVLELGDLDLLAPALAGLTERQARERWGEKVRITEFEYAKLDRAITAGEAYGFAKLIGDPRGRLVGATVAAPGGGDAIAELTAHIARGEKIDAVSRTVHAYPTLAEGPARAADEYLEARYTSPRMRALTRRALAVLRVLHRNR